MIEKMEKILAGMALSAEQRSQVESCLAECRQVNQKLEMFKLIATFMVDTATIYDLELNLKYVCPAVTALRGLTVEEAMREKLDQVLTPKSLDAITRLFHAEMLLEESGTADPDRTQIIELQEYCKDGSIIDVEITLGFIRDENRKATGIISVTRDITKRKKAEIELRASQKMLAEILKMIPVAVFWKDINSRYLGCNTFFSQDAGISPEEISGKTDEDLSWSDRAEVYRNYDRKVIEGERAELFIEDFHKMPGDKIRETLTNKVPLFNYAGKIIGVLGAYIDITEYKTSERERIKLEEQLRHIDKMDSLGLLAGGIAHDFNNLLMVILGNTSLLSMIDEFVLNATVKDRLNDIRKAAESGSGLTRQLLGFARQGNYEIRSVDPNVILKETLKMFSRTKKEIILTENLQEKIWLIEADAGQLKQAFLNIYVNAWQSMPCGGRIHTLTENIVLNKEQASTFSLKPGAYMKVSITDTGDGIDPAIQGHIFEPFFTTKEIGRGTGLGLAMVYGIISAHKGNICVNSEPGHGTTFTIYLPASEKKSSQKESDAAALFYGTETILLIDDEDLVINVGRDMLKFIGYQVFIAHDGTEAITIFSENFEKIDLVILDMIMPGMSGAEVFVQLRKINPKIKIIFSSGYSKKECAQKIIQKGCNGFIQKPFGIKKLSRKIREILDSK